MDKKKIFSIILIVVGLSIIIGSYMLPRYGVKSAYNNAMKLDEIALQENLEKQQAKSKNEDVFDFSQVESINELTPITKINTENVIGGLYIPSVQIKMPIMYGATHENMLNGVGTLKPNMVMGEANYSLAGHNHPQPNLMLAPLKKMKKSYKMYITDKQNIYEYNTSSIEVVMPERVDVIEDVEGKNELTLVSCYSDDGHDRIIVKGDLINVTPYKDATQDLLRAFNNY